MTGRGRSRHLCLAAVLCVLIAGPAWPRVELAGVRFPASLRVGQKTLVPVSCGIRDTLWIDHYAVALYVPRGSDATAAGDPNVPTAVVLRMIETRYMPEQIPEKWLDALERAVTPHELAPIRRAYRRLGDNDRISMRYTPRSGMSLSLNGRTVASLRGRAAMDAVLTAWADGENVIAKLRELGSEHRCN